MIGRTLTLVVIVLALLASACSGSSQEAAPTGSSSASSQTLDPSTRLTDLAHPDKTVDLFSLFNADQGTPRLVMLISPT